MLLAIPASATMDWVRGGYKLNVCGLKDWRPLWWERLCKFGHGALLCAIAGVWWPWLPLCGVLWWLGEKPGWGYTLGWISHGQDPLIWDKGADGHPSDGPEAWQRLLGLDKWPWLSLFIRGAMWALPLLVIAWWQPAVWYVVPAATVAMPVGAWVEHLSKQSVDGQWVRGAVVAAVILLLSYA